jgi:hypothetical protein
VAGEDGLYAADLWLMEFGSYSVRVIVNGGRGTGETFVPVQAIATRTLPLGKGLGFVLAALGILLVAGAIRLVGAAVGEAVLKPGAKPDPQRKKLANIAMGVTAVVLVGALLGARAWWDEEAALYRSQIHRPLTMDAGMAIDRTSFARSVLLTVTDPRWRSGEVPALVADHGKIMHAFMIGSNTPSFMHLHPTRLDRDNFAASLPPDLPSDRYYVYADIVHEDGFAQTMFDSVSITVLPNMPTSTAWAKTDADDAWATPTPSPYTLTASPLAALADGSSMLWRHDATPIRAGADVVLRFVVAGPDGKGAQLEPYAGMLAHSVVRKKDGTVFEHLHPAGNISMAAQRLFTEERTRGASERSARRDSTAAVDSTGHEPAHASRSATTPSGPVITLPYAFPSAGEYRLWVQVKRNGQVLTAVYDVNVTE